MGTLGNLVGKGASGSLVECGLQLDFDFFWNSEGMAQFIHSCISSSSMSAVPTPTAEAIHRQRLSSDLRIPDLARALSTYFPPGTSEQYHVRCSDYLLVCLSDLEGKVPKCLITSSRSLQAEWQSVRFLWSAPPPPSEEAPLWRLGPWRPTFLPLLFLLVRFVRDS